MFSTLPMIMTWTRIVAIPLILLVFYLPITLPVANLIATVMFVVFALTDWLDGYLARKLNQMTRLGQLLDPAADRLFILASLLGLAITNAVPWWLVFVVVGRDFLLFFTFPFLAKAGYGPLPVNYSGKAGTFALLYAFPLMLLPNVLPEGWTNVVLPIAWAFAFWGIWLYWWAGAIYVRQVYNIRKMDRENSSILVSKKESK
jgi:cardiolipin synthase